MAGIPPPKDQPEVTVVIEPVNDAYNVGDVVRTLSSEYLSSSPNKVTPENMVALLDELSGLTDAMLEVDKNRQWLLPLEDPCDQIFRDLHRWKMRLDDYRRRASQAAADNPTERRAILWDVTAPLFLGFYGGPTGTELPIPGADEEPRRVFKPYVGLTPISGLVRPEWCEVTQSLPPGFDPKKKHAADIATVFTLANQLRVHEQHAVRIAGQLADDIIKNAKEIGKTIVFPSHNPYLKYALIGAGAIGSVYLFSRLS